MSNFALIISEHELVAFRDLSYDTNPLHTDEAYARQSVFGQRVVFGVLVLLKVLSRWQKGRTQPLKNIHVQFKRPLFLNRHYHVEIEDLNDGVAIRIVYGTRLQALIRVYCLAGAAIPDWPTQGEIAIAPVTPKPNAKADETRTYSPNLNSLTESLRLLELDRSFISWEQFVFFLWSSFTVGTENPGERALYSELRASFSSPGIRPDVDIEINRYAMAYSDVYKVQKITGRAQGVENFEIQAFMRPSKIDIQADLLASLPRLPADLMCRNALVVGGGRGFGLASAMILALNGAKVESWGRSFSEKHDGVTFVQVDAQDPEAVGAHVRSIENLSIDLLVLNASPTIEAGKFIDLGEDDWLRFFLESASLYLVPFRALIPKLHSEAVVVIVSSVYVTEAPREFSHYVAAKAGIEGAFRALSKEFTNLKFMIYQPPKMLTNQTNTIRKESTMHQSEHVGYDMIQKVIELKRQNEMNASNIIVKEFG